MKREAGGPCLSAVFVDYDNIYLSLKRKSEEAAKRFAKDAGAWLREIETGRLLTSTNAPFESIKRRIVMNRCYGNPVPRRNAHDNSTDMNSFPFVRHHFLRSGFEVIDCPPLTAQLKNSSDIRMVMDIRDLLTHDTYFDEFIILSGDADFTPVLIRLRAHARRTVIFANDFTAAPYTAISDGEVRESDLISLILTGELPPEDEIGLPATATAAISGIGPDPARREIINEVVAGVRASYAPVPLEALAQRAERALGHDKTVATGWGGAGSFRELLRQSLPQGIKLTEEPPYLAFDPKRHETGRPLSLSASKPESESITRGSEAGRLAALAATAEMMAKASPPTHAQTQPEVHRAASAANVRPAVAPPEAHAPTTPVVVPSAIQQSITRIQDACQAPPLAPHEYRLLFEVMAQEISENDLIGAQTLLNITQRAKDRGLELRRDDVRFVLEVVSEADPWFEQGASANLFAGRFRNFVVARCRGQGINLTADELDLIDAWFAGGTLPQPKPAAAPPSKPTHGAAAVKPVPMAAVSKKPGTPAPAPSAATPAGGRWWSFSETREQDTDTRPTHTAQAPSQSQAAAGGEEFPRIVRTRMRS